MGVVEDLRRAGAGEPEAVAAARKRAGRTPPPPSPEVGRLLAWIAASSQARNVVEFGCASGVTGLWLLEGMADRPVLTSIEPDAEVKDRAAQAFDEAGASRTVRSILGEPAQVLERLSDDAYDLCLIQTAPAAPLVDEALRLLRPGGVLVLLDLERTAADDWRTVVGDLVADDRLRCAPLPLDGVLLLATVVG